MSERGEWRWPRVVREARAGTAATIRSAGGLAIVGALALFAIASLVPVRGLWLLHTDHGVDMQTRWQEVQYLLRGVDPITRTSDGGDVEIVFEDLAIPGREVALGVYPPWSYVMSVPLLFPETLRGATTWFVALNGGLLAVLAAWAWGTGWRLAGPAFAFGCTLGVLVLDGVARTLTVGNYGVVVLVLLVGALVFAERGRAGLAGTLFGLSLLKPTLAGPFVLPLMVIAWRGGPWGVFRLLGCATAVVVGTSLVFWWVTGTDPVTAFLKGQTYLPYFATEGGGSPQLWRTYLTLPGVRVGAFHLELDQYAGMVLSLAVGTLAALALARRGTALEQFGVASVVAMTWTYHRPYDSLLLVFLLLALAAHGLRGERPGAPWIAVPTTLVVGVTLWLPSRYIGWPDSTPLLQGVWIAAALVLVVLARQRVSTAHGANAPPAAPPTVPPAAP